MRSLANSFSTSISTLLATPRSKSAFSHPLFISTLYYFRILLACLQFLVQTPCPHCYTCKKDILDLGTTHDYQRQAHIHDDTHSIWYTIKQSCELIFKSNYSMSSKAIKNLLTLKSLTPQQVCPTFLNLWYTFSLSLRVCSQFNSLNTASTFTKCLLSISCTSSNSVYESPYSCIFFRWFI